MQEISLRAEISLISRFWTYICFGVLCPCVKPVRYICTSHTYQRVTKRVAYIFIKQPGDVVHLVEKRDPKVMWRIMLRYIGWDIIPTLGVLFRKPFFPILLCHLKIMTEEVITGRFKITTVADAPNEDSELIITNSVA